MRIVALRIGKFGPFGRTFEMGTECFVLKTESVLGTHIAVVGTEGPLLVERPALRTENPVLESEGAPLGESFLPGTE